VSADRFDGIRIFRREVQNTGTVGGTEATAAGLEAVTANLPGGENADVRTYLTRTLSERFREAFFAKAVLIVEGPSDEAIFSAAGELLGIADLAANGITVVHVGKGSQPIALAILRALGIPIYCVFDADANATDGEACETCGRQKRNRSSAEASNRKVLHALGATEESFPPAAVTETWACFHEELEDAIPGFRNHAAAVANEMGWRGKSPEAYGEAVRRVGKAALPAELVEILEKVMALAQATAAAEAG